MEDKESIRWLESMVDTLMADSESFKNNIDSLNNRVEGLERFVDKLEDLLSDIKKKQTSKK